LTLYRGDWNNKKIYLLWHAFSSATHLFYNEDGARVNDEFDAVISKSKNWELVYQIKDGVLIDNK